MQQDASVDRDTLVEVLNAAVRAYERKTLGQSFLSRERPGREILGPVADAIDTCAAYRQVAGHVLYSGNGGLVVAAGTLAMHLFDRASGDVTAAADWLLRLLSTRSANATFKAAIWGLSIKEEIRLSESSRLLPFADLPTSPMKERIINRSRRRMGRKLAVSPEVVLLIHAE
jgi:hypothetical protein